MSIRVTYIYSASVKIETPDFSILTDPWFTDGIYDGTWYSYPKVENPIEKIGKVDAIYVSHIHPDHYDSAFLRAYLNKYPNTKILIGDFKHNFLQKKMRADGIKPEIVTSAKFGKTGIFILPNEDGSLSDIDSALIVKYDDHSIINMNDCQYNQEHIDQISNICPKPDIALLGYTGAGPYPQTYYTDEAKLTELALAKKLSFIERYKQMKAALNPKKTIPFAGKYILGGKLYYLNKFRGVADAYEIAATDPDAILLDDGCDAYVDTKDLKPSRLRTKAYDEKQVNAYLETIKNKPYLYETYFSGMPIEDTPIMKLMPKCYKKALAVSQCTSDYWFCFKFRDKWLVINANKENESYQILADVNKLTPRSEIIIDYRYLFGLLSGVFHWNNAEVGSQFFTTRVPDKFDRNTQSFLNFLTV